MLTLKRKYCTGCWSEIIESLHNGNDKLNYMLTNMEIVINSGTDDTTNIKNDIVIHALQHIRSNSDTGNELEMGIANQINKNAKYQYNQNAGHSMRVDSNGNYNHDDMDIDDDKWFYRSIILTMNARDDLCFRLSSDRLAMYVFNDSLNKQYLIAMSGLFVSITAIVAIFINHTRLSFIFRSSADIIAIITCSRYLATANSKMTILITWTFHFWFKLYNLLSNVSFVAISMIDTNREGYKRPLYCITVLAIELTVTYGVIFKIDAMLVPNEKIKIISTLLLAAAAASWVGIKAYFAYEDDIYLNPIKSYGIEETTISYKRTFSYSIENLVCIKTIVLRSFCVFAIVCHGYDFILARSIPYSGLLSCLCLQYFK